jgi:hypothetical protein
MAFQGGKAEVVEHLINLGKSVGVMFYI